LEKFQQVAVLSLGGIAGVNARYWLGLGITRWAGPQFPWATFAINVSGSFAIGFLATALARWLPHPYARLLIVTGFLGGYTTYSSYAFESLMLWERGERWASLGYTFGTLVAGLAAVVLGVALARGLPAARGDGAASPSGPASTSAAVVQGREGRP
jgi:CrcB protein